MATRARIGIIIFLIFFWTSSSNAEWILDKMPIEMNKGNIKSLYEVGKSVSYDCEWYLKMEKKVSEAGLKENCHNHFMINNTLMDWLDKYPETYKKYLSELLAEDYGFELAFEKYNDRTNNTTLMMTLKFAQLKSILN
jgi:hypothetical protein